MLIGVIDHKSDLGAEEFLLKLDWTMCQIKKTDVVPDILIGPDYGLVTREAMTEKRPNTQGERYAIIKSIKEISRQLPQTLVIPGTMFWHQRNKNQPDDAFLSALAYRGGHMMEEFFKERDNSESQCAAAYGKRIGREVVYSRGNNKNNFLDIRGSRVAIEICGDHGNQDATGVDLELILAYDNKAGFYISSSNDSWSRYGIVCDGYSGQHIAQYYDPDKRSILPVKSMIRNAPATLVLYDLKLPSGDNR